MATQGTSTRAFATSHPHCLEFTGLLTGSQSVEEPLGSGNGEIVAGVELAAADGEPATAGAALRLRISRSWRAARRAMVRRVSATVMF